jgi:hypothetical protein
MPTLISSEGPNFGGVGRSPYRKNCSAQVLERLGSRKGVVAVKLPEWFTQFKLWLVEIASLVSLGMWIFWALWHEYQHLFP